MRVPGEDDAAVAARLRARLATRLARGVLTPQEMERVASVRLEVFDEGDLASEAFRRCCAAAEVDRPQPITSHRPVIGAVIVTVKRVVARVLRFQTEKTLIRQREFNENVLQVLRELLRRTSGDRIR